MDKYISSIDELNLGKRINGGSCSSIHEFEPGIYFKKVEEDYQDLTDPINMEFYEVIRHLSNIKGMPYIIRAKDIYRSQNTLFGYSMPVVQAQELRSISDEVFIDDILHGFSILSTDIRTLADNHVKTEDVGGNNILYNGFMYLLDLDLSLVDKRYIPDELYERTMKSILCGIKEHVLGEARYDDVVNVTEWNTYFDRLIEVCSTAIGQEAKTIKDIKKGYQKVKSIYRC